MAGSRRRRWIPIATMACAALLGGTATAGAATFVVDSAADIGAASPENDGVCTALTVTGACTLRAAVKEAQNTPGDDRIVLPAGTYALTLGEFFISFSQGRIAIDGAGAATTVIDAIGGGRIMTLASGNPDVTFNRVTLTGGQVADGGAAVTMGVGSALTISESVVRGNTVSGGSSAYGGAINRFSGTLTIDRSTFSGNTVSGSTSAYGGAIYAQGAAPFVITNSTVTGNSAQYGGGVVSSGAPLTITASTFADNLATANQGNLLVSNNPVLRIRGSVFRRSAAAGQPTSQCQTGTGLTADSTGNLESGGDCFVATGNRQNADPALSALADTGGGVPTMRPVAGSPAIDAIPCVAGVTTDQRGAGRPAGASCDVGAVEVGADLGLSVTTPAPAASRVGTSFTASLSVINGGFDPVGLASVTTVLPAGLAFVAAGSTVGCAPMAGVVTCPVPALAVGASAPVTLVLTPTVAGPSAATARVGGGRPGDPSAANDTVTIATTATAGAVAIRPAFTLFRVTPRAFAATTAARARTPRRITFRFRTSEAARVTVVIRRVAAGRRTSAGRCIAVTAANARRSRCTRLIRAGVLKSTSSTTRKSLVFTGRIGRRVLIPGRYRAVATARTPDGRVSAARTRTFTILAR